jgi:hypothetical protein
LDTTEKIFSSNLILKEVLKHEAQKLLTQAFTEPGFFIPLFETKIPSGKGESQPEIENEGVSIPVIRKKSSNCPQN